MRIEQRIGRIDRYGQLSESVAIMNMITRHTIDADIYDRCLMRIGIFERSVGGSEEILGSLSDGIRSIVENLNLTPEERRKQLQQLADNEIRLIEELAKMETEQASLFGLDYRQALDANLKDAQSPWLTEDHLQTLVETYLETRGYQPARPWPRGRRHVLRSTQEVRDALLQDYERLESSMSGNPSAEDLRWRRWLRSANPSLTITFNREEAADNAAAELLSPTHPLVRQAAQELADTAPAQITLSSTHDGSLPPGRHPFLILGWQTMSLRDDFDIIVVSATTTDQGVLVGVIKAAECDDDVQPQTTEEAQQLDAVQHRLWADRRAAHIESLQDIVNARLRSLTSTHSARIALLEDQVEAVSDRNIRRMREAQIAAANADFERRRSQLQEVGRHGDITAGVLIRGVVEIQDR